MLKEERTRTGITTLEHNVSKTQYNTGIRYWRETDDKGACLMKPCLVSWYTHCALALPHFSFTRGIRSCMCIMLPRLSDFVVSCLGTQTPSWNLGFSLYTEFLCGLLLLSRLPTPQPCAHPWWPQINQIRSIPGHQILRPFNTGLPAPGRGPPGLWTSSPAPQPLTVRESGTWRDRLDTMMLFHILLSLGVEESNDRKSKRLLPHLTHFRPVRVTRGKLKKKKN